ncbi:MAG: hypothetical protein ACI89U_002265 [Gammaproteobacteria bacterium]|jgi:hypothetical protein
MRHVMLNFFLIVLFVVFSTMLAENSVAQLVQSKETDSDKSGLSIQSLQDQRQHLRRQINEQENALAALLTKHGVQWDQLESAQKGLENATVAFANDNSKSNGSKLRNARFKSVLAKRKFNKITTIKNELSNQTVLLTEKLNITERKLDTLEPKSDSAAAKNAEEKLPIFSRKQSQTISSSANGNAVEKKLETNEIKRVKSEKKTEISRLTTLLKQQTENQLESKQAIKESPQKLPKHKANSTLDNDNKIATPASTAEQTTVNPSYSNLDNGAKSSSSKSTIEQLHSIEQVRFVEWRLRRILSQKSNSHANYNKMIIVKSLGKYEQKSASNSYTLRTLGHDQYKAEIELLTGRNQLVIGFKRWTITVPKWQQDHQYTVILDNSNGDSPRVTCFPQSLSSES